MTINIKRILLPTDFSENSAAAAQHACELAVTFHAELHLLHTLESHVSTTPQFGMGVVLQKQIEESTQSAEMSLQQVLDPQWASRLKVVPVVLHGSPKSEIVRYARENEIDLIIISTHGRAGVSHLMLGSVAESIVRTAPCPVLTVRSEGHQFVTP